MQADVTCRIYMRYIPGVVPKMRVKYGARIFDILSVINTTDTAGRSRTFP